MATIKSYTDVSQSKVLAGILPLESADMYWFVPADNEGEFIEKVELIRYKSDYNMFDKITDWDDTPYIPCWSLAALLDVLPRYELNNFGDTILLDVNREALATEGDETLIDLVANMIIYLHELKML